MKLDSAARTHAGRVRAKNEDAYVNRPQAGLFAVIDGMGGQQSGEIAAAIAAEVLGQVPAGSGLASEALLAGALRDARTRILAEAAANPGHEGMGAVATAARLEDDGRTLAFAHVGDTRLYLVNAAGVRQLSSDHVAPGEGKRPVSRDLGRAEMPEPWVETGRVRVAPGDLVILCSDGLYEPLGDELAPLLGRLRREGATAEAVSRRLVGEALGRGGPDNVTVVAVRVADFERGDRARKVGLAFFAALLLVGALLAAAAVGAAAQARRGAPPTELPARLDQSRSFYQQDRWTLLPQARTEVGPGVVFGLRGGHVKGLDWTVVVGPGGSLQLERSVLELEGALIIELGEGASALFFDSRVVAGRVIVRGPESATVRYRYAAFQVADEGVGLEGPKLTEDLRLELP